MKFVDLIQIVVAIAVLAVLGFQGINLILHPEAFLLKLNRPATEKHVRATRFIGSVGLALFFLALFQWLRGLWKSN